MRLRDALVALAKQPSPILLSVSLAGWICLFALGRETRSLPLCLSYETLTGTADGIFATAFEARPLPLMTLSWLAMLLAMMSPLLTQPVAQLRLRSLKRRRNRAVALFVVGYLAIWMLAGIVLGAGATALALLSRYLDLPALSIAAAFAAIWQAAPLRQRALNRCHRLPRLSAFGNEADRDCAGFGLTHGFWCATTCSPLMLLPLTAPAFHFALMFAVSTGLLLERMVPPRHPAWTFRILPGQAVATRLSRSITWGVNDHRYSRLPKG
jgi:predicted metal-binding membrane protein